MIYIYIYIYKKYGSIDKLDPVTKRVNSSIYNSIKSEYNLSKNKYSYESCIVLLVLIIYGFNSQIRFNSKGEFNIPSGKQILNETRKQCLVDFSSTLNRKNIDFSSLDFQEFIYLKMQETREDDFWYFDPPYLISGAIYNQAWTLEEDRKLFKLLDLLDSKNIKWGLSNLFQSKGKSNTELIEWSKKYKVFHLNKQYTNSNYQRKNRDQLDDEVYVTNYEKAGI